MNHSITRRFTLAVGVVLSAAAFSANAFPDRPITLIVPFAPGGSSDIVARTIAPRLSEKLGQPVVIENASGAGGVLGTSRAVRAAPDGYTVLLGSGSEILINQLINPKTPYDGQKDLAPVAFMGTGPMVLIGKTSLAAKTTEELLQLAKAKPGSLNYASAGNGTPMNVAGELLKMRAGVAIAHVPYRGAAPAITDIVGGQIDLGVSTLTAALPYIRTGKVKAFAVTSAQRSELAPEIPTLAQTPGLAGFDLGAWFGLFVPRKTSPDIVKKIEAAALEVLNDGTVKKRLVENGITPNGASGESLAKFMQSESAKYQAVVKAANITVE